MAEKPTTQMGEGEDDFPGTPEEALLVRVCGWPPALAKAAVDEFDYAARIRGAEVVRFARAESVAPGWVRLFGTHHSTSEDIFNGSKPGGFPCPRGLEVRVADILWIADAPEGS